MNRLSMVLNSTGSFLLILVAALLLLLSAGIMVNAFIDLRSTNRRITAIVDDATDSLLGERALDEKSGGSSGKAYLDQLQSRSRSALDSSTISFLFQVFALSLISAGVYMLSRYHKSLLAMEQNAKRIIVSKDALKDFIEDGITSSTLGGIVSTGFGLGCNMRNGSKETIQSCLPLIRESTKQIRDLLETARTNNKGLHRSQRDVFVDQLTQIRDDLKNANASTDIVGQCEECVEILEKGGFVERYAARLETLEVTLGGEF